jgi:serine protease AprX
MVVAVRPARSIVGMATAAAVLAAVVGSAGSAAAVPSPASATPLLAERLAAPTAVQTAEPTTPFGGGRVVVSGADAATIAAAVRAAGGTVVDALPLVGGVVADLPAGAQLPGLVVAGDRRLAVAAAESDSDASGDEPGPVLTDRATVGLDAAAPTGEGVTVAVVDTGVADVPDLTGRVLHIDATLRHPRTTEPSSRGVGDGYGHGTFVAGLVAGDGRASGGRYTGSAPGARVLDVRVAGDDGSTSLVSVLRGLQAVAANADALNVRVLNLSLASGSPLPYQLDPLTQALEALWRQGITVVTAAGNDGPTPGAVSSPGLDPTLLTAGALDEAGTPDRADDTVAPYSSRGPAAQGVAKPDVVAPGSHLVSLRAPGSTVDAENPASRVGTDYFRGSGTSMSTAVTSGVVADLLSARPDLTPDQVKSLLVGTAYTAPGLPRGDAAGAGGVDAAAALAAPTPAVEQHGNSNPVRPGPARLWDRFSAAVLDGDRSKAARLWREFSPEMRSWVDQAWASLDPATRDWVGRSWVGRSWVGADGSAEDWVARSWVARSWIADSWVGRSWVGRSWVGRSWVGRSWVGRSWIDDNWVASAWAGSSWV